MLITAASIVVAWAVLLGAAYCARRAGLGEARSVAIVAAAYVALSGLALAWFGLNQTGFLGAFGMLLPCAAAIGLVLLSPVRR